MSRLDTLVRSSCIALFLYSISLRDADHWPESQKSRNQYGGHCRYLTFLNVCLSIITSALFIVGIFNRTAHKLASNLAVSLSLPVSLVVFTSFWGIYYYDREMIHPVRIEAYYTQTMSSIDHGLVLPLALFNCVKSTSTISRRQAYCLTILAYFGYTVWLLHIRTVTGSFVYPFMNVLGLRNVLSIFLPCLFAVGCCFLEMAFVINARFSRGHSKTE